jgi:hypothetical protein
MRLNLDSTGIVDPSTQGELKSAFEIIEEIERYLQDEMGVEPAKKPENQPKDLSTIADRADNLSNEELALYLSQYTAWASFYDARLSLITAAHKIAERNRKLAASEISMQLFREKVAKTEVPDRVRVDGMHKQFELEELKLYVMKKLLEARYKAYDKQAATISRLITLRQEDMERQRIEANLKHRGGSPHRKRFQRGQESE